MEEKNMTKIHEFEHKIRRVSKSHEKSLILPVPAKVRDIMELKHDDKVMWEIHVNENGEKYLIIRKID